MTGVGTPEYMSPEMATARQRGRKRGFKHDAKVDAWSVGVTLFELVTEEFPVQAGNLNVSTIIFAHKIVKHTEYPLYGIVDKSPPPSTVQRS